MQDTAARVLSCETMAQDLVRIILSAPDIAAQAKAGQFIHILVPDSGHAPRLSIPLQPPQTPQPSVSTTTYLLHTERLLPLSPS